MKDALYFLSDGGSVERYHTRPGIKPDTVGRHSHGVAMLAYLLHDAAPSAELLMACLTHDLAEQVVGDVSSPAKRKLGLGEKLDQLELGILARIGHVHTLSQYEAQIMKLADIADGMLRCCREAALGNRTVQIVYNRYADYKVQLHLEYNHAVQRDQVREVFIAIHEMWEESNGQRQTEYDCFNYVNEHRER